MQVTESFCFQLAPIFEGTGTAFCHTDTQGSLYWEWDVPLIGATALSPGIVVGTTNEGHFFATMKQKLAFY